MHLSFRQILSRLWCNNTTLVAAYSVSKLTLSTKCTARLRAEMNLATGAHQGKEWKLLLSLNFHHTMLAPRLEIPSDRYSFPPRLCVVFPAAYLQVSFSLSPLAGLIISSGQIYSVYLFIYIC